MPTSGPPTTRSSTSRSAASGAVVTVGPPRTRTAPSRSASATRASRGTSRPLTRHGSVSVPPGSIVSTSAPRVASGWASTTTSRARPAHRSSIVRKARTPYVVAAPRARGEPFTLGGGSDPVNGQDLPGSLVVVPRGAAPVEPVVEPLEQGSGVHRHRPGGRAPAGTPSPRRRSESCPDAEAQPAQQRERALPGLQRRRRDRRGWLLHCLPRPGDRHQPARGAEAPAHRP